MKKSKVEFVTRESLISMLANANEEKKAQIIGRALVAIFRKQTLSEQSSNKTAVHNNCGFSPVDAKSGCITAKYFIHHKTLQPWQMDMWLRDFRGHPRITKYARQLNIIAIENRIFDLRHKARLTTTSDDDKARFLQDADLLALQLAGRA